MRDHRVRAIVVVAALAWLVATLFSDFPSSRTDVVSLIQALLRFGGALTAAVFLCNVYEKWLWHLPIFHGWISMTPDLRGTWRVALNSTFVDEKGKPAGPISAYMRVEQTESTLSMHLFSRESTSHLVAHALSRKGVDFEVAAVFRNTPDIGLQDNGSRPHDGAFALRGVGFEPTRLQGPYWTDRKTAGTMVLTDRRRKGVIDSYESGQRMFRDV